MQLRASPCKSPPTVANGPIRSNSLSKTTLSHRIPPRFVPTFRRGPPSLHRIIQDFVSARHSTSSVQSSSTAAPIAISSHFARRCSRHNATPGLLFTPAVSQVLYLQCFLEVSGTFARSWTHTSPLIASPPANNHLQAPMHTHQRPNSQPYIDQPLVTRGAAAKSILA